MIYYGYISDFGPEYIVVEKDGVRKEIYKSIDVVTNMKLRENNISIKVVEPEHGLVYTKEVRKEVFGYTITCDNTGTYKELYSNPKGNN